METVHTAELIIGLGVERVVVDKGFYKTERTPEHFVRRLGRACVPVVRSQDNVQTAEAAGAECLWSESADTLIRVKAIAVGYDEGTAWGRAVFPEKDA
jgi:hypothetical protein